MSYHVTYRVMMLKLLDAGLDGIFFVGGFLLTTTWPFALPSVIDESTGRPLVSAAIAGLYGCIAMVLESMDGTVPIPGLSSYTRARVRRPVPRRHASLLTKLGPTEEMGQTPNEYF